MKTKFLGLRKPTAAEKKKGAEVVFLREKQNGQEIKIFASKCYESWEQWGSESEILSENVPQVEKWRNKQNN